MSPYRVKVFRATRFGDWEWRCGCTDSCWAGSWRDALEGALGHLCLGAHWPLAVDNDHDEE